MPVVGSSSDGPRPLGTSARSNVAHVFPADINPFAVNAAESVAAIERDQQELR